ncbi:hypothetical protein N9H93_04200 [Rhizobiaceae bacterium]|nr:hypothetical protein [Rhizobiaceae bacterium]
MTRRELLNHITGLGVMAAILIPALGLTASAQETACRMEGVELACGSADTSAQDMALILGHEETLNLLSAPALPLTFGTTQEREAFRISLERNRSRANEYGKEAFAKFRRKEITLAELEAVRAEMAAAIASYRAGIDAYRNTYWTDPDWKWNFGD